MIKATNSGHFVEINQDNSNIRIINEYIQSLTVKQDAFKNDMTRKLGHQIQFT